MSCTCSSIFYNNLWQAESQFIRFKVKIRHTVVIHHDKQKQGDIE